jgi:hypothetical protein
MWTLTLDTNCLINLENDSGQVDSIRRLLVLHRENKIRLFINEASAGENLPGKAAPQNFSTFADRLDRLGLDDLPSIAPLARLDVSFFLDHSILATDADIELEDKIMAILRPSGPKSYADHLADEGLAVDSAITAKWRNLYSDVDAILGHIRSGHDIFVTEDRHFLRPDARQRLLALGAKDILTPAEALTKVTTVPAP